MKTTRRSFIAGITGTGVAATTLATGPTLAPAYADSAAVDAVLAVNAGMRTNYAKLKADLIAHLSPVIVVQNDAKGGKFTLVTADGRESVNPVGPDFELAKSIAHIPLACYTILAAYLPDVVPNVVNANRIDQHDLLMVAFADDSSTAWLAPLQAYAGTLAAARGALDATGMPTELQESSGRIIDAAMTYIDQTVAAQKVDMKAFEEFTGNVYDDIRINMRYASSAQIDGVRLQMSIWRKHLGEDAWKDLYTVVLSQWTTSVLNQNTIIIKGLMDQSRVSTHLIDLPGLETPADPIFTALDNLARIVQDNIAAEMVFPKDTHVADALKGSQDLLSDEILKQLGDDTSGTSPALYNLTADKAACPFSG